MSAELPRLLPGEIDRLLPLAMDDVTLAIATGIVDYPQNPSKDARRQHMESQWRVFQQKVARLNELIAAWEIIQREKLAL